MSSRLGSESFLERYALSNGVSERKQPGLVAVRCLPRSRRWNWKAESKLPEELLNLRCFVGCSLFGKFAESVAGPRADVT